jgi:DNA-binding transcriptional regulator PaaX
MKKNIKQNLLNCLIDGVDNTIDLFFAYLNSGYGASVKKIKYEQEKISNLNKLNEKEKIDKENFFNYLNYLKKDGLIEKTGRGFSSKIKITNKGKKIIKNKKTTLPNINYKKIKNNSLILITFDIPENKRSARDWLRRSLLFLEFKLIRQSVFIGSNKIPNKFIMDLKRLNIFENVDILEVEKLGTLKRLK